MEDQTARTKVKPRWGITAARDLLREQDLAVSDEAFEAEVEKARSPRAKADTIANRTKKTTSASRTATGTGTVDARRKNRSKNP